MKSMLADQMNNMLAEGGVMQEGGTVDPVSGNEVPVGAMQEEVRDDIDAKLSEGEFVFPADVVRFYGLEKLMMMRDKAKKGLQRMNEIGQMGNAEEVPDGEALFGDKEMDDDMFSSEIDSIMAEEEQV
jgi:Arc/MetJ-type ribon-helix-helix transcriptional regulator